MTATTTKPTDKTKEQEHRQYDELIEAIHEAIKENIIEHGPLKTSILEGALGYHLSCTFDHYPADVRPQVIEHFCSHLRTPANDLH